jgi:exodeoxyribonuclease III
VRLATWNVNSLKARQDRVEEWIAYARPDVLCLQETKLADDAFPALAFSALGYDSVHHGHNQWNGVAILSRVGIDSVTTGFEGAADPYEGDARLIAATCGGVRVISVYVPNGREVGTEFYVRKLEWFGALHDWLARSSSPADEVAVLGDFNVAPEDRDVWSAKAFAGSTHVTESERAAVRRLCEWGMEDAFRRLYPDADRLFTYWDYRAGAFHQHRGMRIDLVLASAPLAARAEWAVVDRNARKGKQPSDHAPVIVDFTDGGTA